MEPSNGKGSSMATARRLRWIAAWGGAALVATIAYVALQVVDSVGVTHGEDAEGKSPGVHLDFQAPPGLEEVLAAQAAVDEDTPEGQLVLAARSGDAEGVLQLLAQGLAPDAEEPENGHRALQQAAAAGQLEVIEILLDAGAAVDARDRDGMTALMRAAVTASVPVGRRLLEAGAAVNAQSPEGETALTQIANGAALRRIRGDAGEGRTPEPGEEVQFARMLFDGGADPNLYSAEGSPLKALAVTQRTDLLTLFVQHGATTESDAELAMLGMISKPIGDALRAATSAVPELPATEEAR